MLHFHHVVIARQEQKEDTESSKWKCHWQAVFELPVLVNFFGALCWLGTSLEESVSSLLASARLGLVPASIISSMDCIHKARANLEVGILHGLKLQGKVLLLCRIFIQV
jgi:hypothetical protein